MHGPTFGVHATFTCTGPHEQTPAPTTYHPLPELHDHMVVTYTEHASSSAPLQHVTPA